MKRIRYCIGVFLTLSIIVGCQNGEYDVIPYVFIQQDNIPEGLMERLGENVKDFSPDFLKMPLKLENNRVEILPR